MGSSNGINYFLELNDRSMAVAKTSPTSDAPVIEVFREACLEDPASIKETIGLITGENSGEPVRIHCALRPARRFFDLASADDARNHKTAAAIEDFVAKSVSIKSDDTHTTAVYAGTGQPFDGSSKEAWLAATVTKQSANDALARVKEWNLACDGFESATVSLIGSVQAALKAANQPAPVVCWDIGETTSDLFLIGPRGIEAARRISFGYDQIAEAIQAEIQLKFKAAAAKLFFNERYDFAGNASKIAGRVAKLLESDMAKLGSASQKAPDHFFCAGLPTRQGWFSRELAAGLQLEAWKPDFAVWAKQAGVALPSGVSDSSCSPSWLGLLGFAAANRTGASAWHPLWNSSPATGGAATPPPAPASAKAQAQPQAQKEAKSAPVPAAVPSKSAAEATPKKAPAPAAATAKTDASKKASEKKVQVAATATKTALAKAFGGGSPLMKRIAIAAAGAVLLGGGFFYFQEVEKQKEAALEAQRVAEQRAAADSEARREAELKALAEAEARAAAERAAAAMAEAEKAAAEKAAQEARLREIEKERLLNARGAVAISTVPEGANVIIGDLAPKSAPASFENLRLGTYTAEISKEGFDPMTVDLEIREDEVTRIGPIRLVRHVGTLVIDTKPPGLSYEIRPADSGLFTSSSQKRIGITPHTIRDLPTDDYIVTIQRDGWPDATERVRIGNDETATVTRDLSGGTVVIESDPIGAEVFADGVSLGITPLTLTNVKPGDVVYTLNRNLYHSSTVRARVAPEKTTSLDVELESIEYIAKSNELDRWPAPARRVEPDLPNPERFAGQSVTLSVTISDRGEPMDVTVTEASDDELAIYCVDAVSQWQFRPGKIGRRSVWTRVTVPFNF